MPGRRRAPLARGRVAVFSAAAHPATVERVERVEPQPLRGDAGGYRGRLALRGSPVRGAGWRARPHRHGLRRGLPHHGQDVRAGGRPGRPAGRTAEVFTVVITRGACAHPVRRQRDGQRLRRPGRRDPRPARPTKGHGRQGWDRRQQLARGPDLPFRPSAGDRPPERATSRLAAAGSSARSRAPSVPTIRMAPRQAVRHRPASVVSAKTPSVDRWLGH